MVRETGFDFKMKPSDFLPQLPWEGPPIPRRLSEHEKYSLVRRTRRGSLVVIEKEGNKAIIDVTDVDDMNDLHKLLTAAHIPYELSQPPKLIGRGWRITFNFSDLAKVIEQIKSRLLE